MALPIGGVDGAARALGRVERDRERLEEQLAHVDGAPGAGVQRLQLRVVAEPAAGEVDGGELGRRACARPRRRRRASCTTTVAVVPMARNERAVSTGSRIRVAPVTATCRPRSRWATRSSPSGPTTRCPCCRCCRSCRCCSSMRCCRPSPRSRAEPEDEVDPDVVARPRCACRRRGGSWATTMPIATVAPVAATMAPRVRRRRRDRGSLPALGRVGLARLTCGWRTSLVGTPLSHHARIDTDARPAVGLL